ncbi:response regulator [Roseisolibacter sp. H3M3-2]|uniref:response regulator n=1 Tax=Roseisolibacter sp. H3M3-2 TaxID=3031323 RepID=UPI0023DACE65|nr:response regulator [Roseisolibacter sp. H3M3-2]MDF1505898.1 response regulator [Roseisolibacter sp. H3M3-2]
MIAVHDGADAPERPTLLVVDDEEHVRFAMQTYFGASGFRVETAATLADAKDVLDRMAPAAVVADLRLTGSDGEEGLELLRHARLARGALPFVLITGFGSPSVHAEAIRLGASAVLTKPKPLADIARVVRALLDAPAA